MTFLKKILLVDHEPQVTALVRRALESTGRFLVKVEADVRLAQHAAPWFRPDLVLLDSAKSADSEEMNRQLHNEPTLKDTPFLYLSGNPTADKKVMTGGFERYNRSHQPPQNPLVARTSGETREVVPGEVNKFPNPRLETDEVHELRDFRDNEEKTLNTYGWVDPYNEVVRIPVDRAMDLIVARGLPARPALGEASEATGAWEATDKARMPQANGLQGPCGYLVKPPAEEEKK